MTCSPDDLPVICDWLDVTYAPDDWPYPDLNLLLLGAEFTVRREITGGSTYVPKDGYGAVKFITGAKFAKVSISGSACGALRDLGLWGDILFTLGTSPHRVTRLDGALDLLIDAAPVIAGLRARYPDGQVKLGRKALPVKVMLEVRPDGLESGTYYVGHRTAARKTVRVYDKALEMLSKRGVQLPPTTRIEVTARKDSGATLRDAFLPAALFWDIAAPAILKAPEDAPMWVPDTEMGFTAPVKEFNPAETMRRRVEVSAELEALLCVADGMGDAGRDYLLHLFTRRIKGLSEAQDAA
jgi:hypothetical protein